MRAIFLHVFSGYFVPHYTLLPSTWLLKNVMPDTLLKGQHLCQLAKMLWKLPPPPGPAGCPYNFHQPPILQWVGSNLRTQPGLFIQIATNMASDICWHLQQVCGPRVPGSVCSNQYHLSGSKNPRNQARLRISGCGALSTAMLHLFLCNTSKLYFQMLCYLEWLDITRNWIRLVLGLIKQTFLVFSESIFQKVSQIC